MQIYAKQARASELLAQILDRAHAEPLPEDGPSLPYIGWRAI